MTRAGRGARGLPRLARLSLLAATAALLVREPAYAAGSRQGNVASTIHNLSASGPGEIRSLTEKEVCKFCHVPHSAAVPVPLWGRRLSEARYATAALRRGKKDEQPAPQPDGSSRLCLSCHDGTIALGELAGRPRTVEMTGSGRLGPGTRGHLGTDLSGSHPVSFVVQDRPRDEDSRDGDMGIRPVSALSHDPDVRLDAEGKMQCTTCHDPHADRYHVPGRVPRFWTKPTVEDVCLACHVPG